MTIGKGFTLVCKAKDLKNKVKEIIERINSMIPENSYDFYAELEYEKRIGTCDQCHDYITTNEDAYKFEDDLIHADCLYDYMQKFKL